MKTIDLLAMKNKFFAWKYDFQELFRQIDSGGGDDLDDPVWLDKEDYITKGEHRYLDLRIPYKSLSEPRNNEEFLLMRKRYWIEYMGDVYEEDHEMLRSYMNISEEELIGIFKSRYNYILST